ncbi:MAG: hypothetical protein WAT79_16160 [Saprospiraceae bacterium]
MFSGNVTDNSPGDAFIQVTTLIYSKSGKAMTKVFFHTQGSDYSMNHNILIIKEKNVSIHKQTSHSVALQGFDENDFDNYPLSGSGLPSKFLLAQGTDKVKLNLNLKGSSSKTKVLNAVTFSDLTPDHLSYFKSGDELELTHVNTETNNTFTIKACTPDINLLDVDIYPQKTMMVEIYTLCESDDDEINYCLSQPWKMLGCSTNITSSLHECIKPGADLTLDRFLDLEFWEANRYDPSKPHDELIYTSPYYHELKIRPRYNSVTNEYICNSLPQANGIACPDLMTPAELDALRSDLNIIYNQAGISVIVEDMGYRNINFDLKNPDDERISSLEQNYLHWQFVGYHGDFPEDMLKPNETIIWRVNSILYSGSGTALGRTTDFGLNSATINTSTSLPSFRTIPHEIGHAKYDLHHPDDDWNNELDMLEKVDTDKYNLMNSGPLFGLIPASNNSEFRIRRYQWKKIQTNN